MDNAVFFDWDDTLLNAGEQLVNSQIKALKDMLIHTDRFPFLKDCPLPKRQDLAHFIGHRFKDTTLPALYPNLDPQNTHHHAWLEQTYQYYLTTYQKLKKSLFTGVHDMLTQLHGDATLCIATNKSYHLLEQELEETGTKSYFRYLITADHPDIGIGKPHPKMINWLQKHFNSKTQFTMVGDQPFDISAANHSQCANRTRTIGVQTHHQNIKSASIMCRSASDITIALIQSLHQTS